jgi:hypothetical protein
MTRHDPMTTLTRLRPTGTVDELWPADRRAAVLERTLADPPPVPRHRRRLAVAVVAGGLVLSGAGAATVGGIMPRAFTAPLSFWSTETGGGVDENTARRVAQGPGPDGRVLSVWAAEGADGTLCVSPMFEPPGPLDRPAPADFALAGGECVPPDLRDQPLGDSMGASADERGVYTVWGTAGTAVRADLRLADGTGRPAVVVAGMFFAWYGPGPAPVLVGYDAADRVVGETSLRIGPR